MKNIRMLNCAKDGGGDLCVNWGWAMQRKISGEWITVAWFRSSKDVKEMLKIFKAHGR